MRRVAGLIYEWIMVMLFGMLFAPLGYLWEWVVFGFQAGQTGFHRVHRQQPKVTIGGGV